MLKLAGKGDSFEENKRKIRECITSGKAFDKLKELVQKQGGDVSFLEDISKFPKARIIEEVKSQKEGYIKELNAEEIGKVSMNLGARTNKKRRCN